MKKEKIYCFDFDGTLTKRDTFIEFIRYAKGNLYCLLGFLLFSPLLVLMKLHYYPNWKAKQKIFKFFFEGMDRDDFEDLCANFAGNNPQLLRSSGIARIQEALRQHERVFIISASSDHWVAPFFLFQGLEDVIILGTEIETTGPYFILTGGFKTPNCYGAEKVRRLKEALIQLDARDNKLSSPRPFDRSRYEIEAFGDSRGDKEMLEFADIAHYKPFR